MQPLRNLGGYIREQRNVSQISLRQLAAAAGVSNPYLSQIERGLRKPSAEILQQIAKGLRISAEALYVQAGMLDERISGSEAAHSIQADLQLSERQKQVLLEIYDSFCKENESATKPAQPAPKKAAKKAQKAAPRAARKKSANSAKSTSTSKSTPSQSTPTKRTSATKTPQ